jgi:DNA primase
LNNKGAAAFTNFITTNKKDFILFQLDIALKDAGDDSSKKSAVVNQIAETISKINKAEDFTRQQDYIRKSAELLKIDESGTKIMRKNNILLKILMMRLIAY